MSLIIYLGYIFLISFLLMLLLVKNKKLTTKAYLVEAHNIKIRERYNIKSLKVFFTSARKIIFRKKGVNLSQIHFGYKQHINIPQSMKNHTAYGKAIGDSMSKRGISNGDYFVFETNNFKSTKNFGKCEYADGDIVVEKVLDNNNEVCGLRLVEINSDTQSTCHNKTKQMNIEKKNTDIKNNHFNIVGRVLGVLS